MHNKNSSLCMQNFCVSLKTPPLPPTKQLRKTVYSKKIYLMLEYQRMAEVKGSLFLKCLV